ncbi:MAG: DUF6514 family protein [Defluviitaleaceae bacterium]|nr:DUF6514 family protein [Defluviitaleaceae bacterium]
METMKTLMSTATANFEMRYYKTTKPSLDEGGELYGIHVEMFTDGEMESEASSGDISQDDGQITELINRLSKGSVTPCNLTEFLDADEMGILHT